MTAGGWAGEVERRRNRVTGTLVVLLDNRDQQAGLDTGEDRWATVCDEHATICSHPTRQLARSHMAAPHGWCEPCQLQEEVEGEFASYSAALRHLSGLGMRQEAVEWQEGMRLETWTDGRAVAQVQVWPAKGAAGHARLTEVELVEVPDPW